MKTNPTKRTKSKAYLIHKFLKRNKKCIKKKILPLALWQFDSGKGLDFWQVYERIVWVVF